MILNNIKCIPYLRDWLLNIFETAPVELTPELLL
jgi:hypothetical protein